MPKSSMSKNQYARVINQECPTCHGEGSLLQIDMDSYERRVRRPGEAIHPDQIRAAVRARIMREFDNNLTAYANAHGIPPTFLSGFLSNRKNRYTVPPSVLRAEGLQARVVYERIPPGKKFNYEEQMGIVGYSNNPALQKD